jgi:hypothetical protein
MPHSFPEEEEAELEVEEDAGGAMEGREEESEEPRLCGSCSEDGRVGGMVGPKAADSEEARTVESSRSDSSESESQSESSSLSVSVSESESSELSSSIKM